MSNQPTRPRHWLRFVSQSSSLRTRVVLLAVVAIAPLALERIASMQEARREQIAAAGRHAFDLAQAMVDRQSEIVVAAKELLQMVGHATERIPLRSRECSRLLADTASDISWARTLSVADAEGRILCSSNPRVLGVDTSGTAHFRAAARGGGFALSDPVYARPGVPPDLHAAYGKRGADGTVASVLMATLAMRPLSQTLPGERPDGEALALLVDSAGIVVASAPEEAGWEGRDLSGTPFLHEIAARGTGTVAIRDPAGTPRIWGFLPLSFGGGKILVGFDERSVLQAADRDTALAYGQFAFSLLLMLLGAWFFGDHAILRPIRTLARHAERIGRGDLSPRAGKAPWAPEFLPLARALDSMAERLRAREHDLRSQSDRFRELATLDSLTGLSNRRVFDQRIAAAWECAAAARSPLGLLMIDVDHFKRFNDRYGHLSGDACLRAIGGILRATAAGVHAQAARYGGEEFVLLLAGDADEAQELAETLRRQVASLRIPHAEAPSGIVTVSVGWAALVPEPGSDFELLIEAADAALYASKRRRNAVTAYEPRALAEAG